MPKFVNESNFDSMSTIVASIPSNSLSDKVAAISLGTKSGPESADATVGGASTAVTITTGAGGGNTSTGAGGAAGAINITSGAGGGAVTGVGAAGGTLSVTAGAGGVAASGTGGAGGTVTVTAGAGADVNGAGGSVNLVPGNADGTGLDGTVQVAGSAAWFAISGSAQQATDLNIYIFAVPAGVNYRVAGITANCSADAGGITWQARFSASATVLTGGTLMTGAAELLTPDTSIVATLVGGAAAELIGAAAPLQVGVVLSGPLAATEVASFTFHLAPTIA